MSESFPRQYARTRRFTLGEPRTFSVTSDGQRAFFLRSASGVDPSNALWVWARSGERILVDPADLLDDSAGIPPAEKARRERARESGEGIVTYACDEAGSLVTFALAGRLFAHNVDTGVTTEHTGAGPVFDPRPNPSGTHIAYVSERSLRVTGVDGGDMQLAGEDDPNVSWGSADFLAAEEMQRSRGFWWSGDGGYLLTTRVDTSPVPVWNISDPNYPENPSRPVRYPHAGASLPITRAYVLSLRGSRREIIWDHNTFPYLASANWTANGCVLVVQNRGQDRMQVLAVDINSGATEVLREISDSAWVEITPGLPAWLGGKLVTAEDSQETRRLCLGDLPVTPAGLQIRSVVGNDNNGLVFVASPEPTVSHLYRLGPDGTVDQLTEGEAVHGAVVGGDTLVESRATLESTISQVSVLVGGKRAASIGSNGEIPQIRCAVSLLTLGDRELASAVLFPSNHVAGRKLPVLLDPYGGPHAQRVQANQRQFLTSQWFADQGFAVVVSDGRGTPARGTSFERAVDGDFATVTLADQVDALEAALDRFDDLDASRVGIRGWSFGGYLAALAVLKRPDIFHAAVAGAPVTDWRFYDTHYTERYLGTPDENPAAYERSSLLGLAADLRRPLLLIHGLADDNVFSVHTLRLSQALMEAGRAHQVLPLSGVSHMTPQEVVAENLLRLQVSFLRESLPAGKGF